MLLISVHSHYHTHGSITGTLRGTLVVLVSTLSSLYWFITILLHSILNNVLLALFIHDFTIGSLSVIGFHSLLMPVLTTLKLVWLMRYWIWSAQVHWSGWLMMIARVHDSSKPLVDRLLLAVAFKAVSEKMGVLLVGLISKSSHLALMCIWLVWLLGAINILLILHIFKRNWVLRLVDELWVASESGVASVMGLTSLSLIDIDSSWFGGLLGGLSWTSSWALTTCFESILRNVVHEPWIDSGLLHLQLL